MKLQTPIVRAATAIIALLLLLAAVSALGRSSPTPPDLSNIRTIDLPWLLESDFDVDPALHATEGQVVVLELEERSDGKGVFRENTIRFLVEQERRFAFCIPAEDPRLVRLRLERNPGFESAKGKAKAKQRRRRGRTILTQRRGGACKPVRLAAGGYTLRVFHDSRDIPEGGKLAFLHDPEQPRLLGGISDSAVPQFLRFGADYNHRWVSTGSSPTLLQAAAESPASWDESFVINPSAVSNRYLFQSASGGPAFVTNGQAECDFPLYGTPYIYHDQALSGNLVDVYFGFHDLGGYDFSLDGWISWQGPSQGCPGDASPVNVEQDSASLYLDQGSLDTPPTAATFTATAKGWTCLDGCDGAAITLGAGEVAFFSECNYQGTVGMSIYDTPQAAPFFSTVNSIRLGPGTFVSMYPDADYQGPLQPVSQDTACLGAPVNLGSFEITTDAKSFVLATDTCIGCNLSGMDLHGIDLSNGDFAQSTFTQADLIGTKLDGASMADTDLSNAELSQASFAGADLTSAKLSQATMAGTSFLGSVLHCTSFASSDLTSAEFSDPADLSRDFSCQLDLTGATVEYGTFPPVDWRYLDLTSSQMQGVPETLSTLAAPLDLSGAILNGVDWLDGKTLDGANLGCYARVSGQTDPCPPSGTVDACSKLQSATLSKVSLQQACLKQAQLQGTDLTYANLDGANLEGADLAALPNGTVAKLTGAFLRDASLAGANLTGVIANFASFYSSDSGTATASAATMTGAKWNNAYLANADFSDAVLQSTEWTQAVLVGANFDGADLSKNATAGEITDFSNAYLQGAVFTNAPVTDADFTNSYWDASGSATLNIELQSGNVEFTGYWGSTPECVEATYPTSSFPSPTLPITSASNTCPNGDTGPCYNAALQTPLTPMGEATPAAAFSPSLPGDCTGTDILWVVPID